MLTSTHSNRQTSYVIGQGEGLRCNIPLAVALPATGPATIIEWGTPIFNSLSDSVEVIGINIEFNKAGLYQIQVVIESVPSGGGVLSITNTLEMIKYPGAGTSYPLDSNTSCFVPNGTNGNTMRQNICSTFYAYPGQYIHVTCRGGDSAHALTVQSSDTFMSLIKIN